MLIGNPSVFAIESEISIAYGALGSRALGFFVIHIGGLCYGVREPNATLMACSFDEVDRRLKRRGQHMAPFSTEPDAGKIIDADYDAGHAPDYETRLFFGISSSEFNSYLGPNGVTWAPDGDEAFDDGSSVFHFDVADRVRLIGYRLRRSQWDYPHDPNVQPAWKGEFHRYQNDPATVRDIWLKADDFYGILESWRDAFIAEWEAAPKPFDSSDAEVSKRHLAEIIRLEKLTEQIRSARNSTES